MSSDLALVIGNKNYSSWSLRPWLLLQHFVVPFQEVNILLSRPDTPEQLAPWSPTFRVPVLKHGGRTIWDSLAICEYVSETFLAGRAWPADAGDRAWARSICAEMHSSFTALRSQWPMNCRLRRKLPIAGELLKDIQRIDALWQECLEAHGGEGYLFGEFSIADCMYAPVVLRFHAYQPALSEAASAYMARVLDNEALQQWIRAGKAEPHVIAEDEVGFMLGEEDWEAEARALIV